MFAEKRYIELFLKSSPSSRSGSFRGLSLDKQTVCALTEMDSSDVLYIQSWADCYLLK